MLRYWRTSLADGALGEGKFTQSDRKRFVEVPGDAVKTGVLPREAIEPVFRGQTSARTIGIRFWPLVMARKSSHGAARAGGLPELVAPVVTEATVDRDGRITPTRNALARGLLTPLPFGEFAIGTNFDIQQFTGNILFDEKIGGSFHMALGAGYPETGSKNKSSIHWDMICDMRTDSEILVDGELFYKNGQFVFEK